MQETHTHSHPSATLPLTHPVPNLPLNHPLTLIRAYKTHYFLRGRLTCRRRNRCLAGLLFSGKTNYEAQWSAGMWGVLRPDILAGRGWGEVVYTICLWRHFRRGMSRNGWEKKGRGTVWGQSECKGITASWIWQMFLYLIYGQIIFKGICNIENGGTAEVAPPYIE